MHYRMVSCTYNASDDVCWRGETNLGYILMHNSEVIDNGKE